MFKFSILLIYIVFTSLYSNAQYCSPIIECLSGKSIHTVFTYGGIHNISNLQTECNEENITNISLTNKNLFAIAGNNITFNIFSSNNYNLYFTVFIDLNNNNSFEDANELIFQSSTRSASAVFNYQIPSLLSNGIYNLRIYGTEYPMMNSCELDIQYHFDRMGEFEDYKLIIVDTICTSIQINTSKNKACDNEFISIYPNYWNQNISHIWQYSNDSINWNNINNTNPYLSLSFVSDVYYRLIYSCNSITDTSNTIKIFKKNYLECYCNNVSILNNSIYNALYIDSININQTFINVFNHQSGFYFNYDNLIVLPKNQFSIVSFFARAGVNLYSNPQVFSIYADLNQNGIYETNELIRNLNVNNVLTNQFNLVDSIFISQNALSGITGLKIRTYNQYFPGISPIQPCEYNQSIKDYNFRILITEPMNDCNTIAQNTIYTEKDSVCLNNITNACIMNYYSNSGYQYVWKKSYDQQNWNAIDTTNTPCLSFMVDSSNCYLKCYVLCNYNLIDSSFVKSFYGIHNTIQTNISDSSICSNETRKIYLDYDYITLNNIPSYSPLYIFPTSLPYNLHIIDNYGCTYTDTFYVFSKPIPIYSTILLPNKSCEGDTVQINLSGNYQFSLSPFVNINDTTGNVYFSFPTEDIQYTITAFDSITGCSRSSNVFVDYINRPTLNLQTTEDTICLNEQAILFDAPSSNNFTYSWNPQIALTPSGNPAAVTVYPSQTTTYYCNKYTTAYCFTTDSITIFVENELTPVTSLGTDILLCAGNNMLLNSNCSAQNYLWETNPIINSIHLSNTPTVFLNTINQIQIGAYEITFTAYNSNTTCATHKKFWLFVNNCLGTEESYNNYEFSYLLKRFDLNRYEILINNLIPENYFLTNVYDLVGNIIISHETNKNEIQIDLNNFSNGIYLLHISDGDKKIITEKLIKN